MQLGGGTGEEKRQKKDIGERKDTCGNIMQPPLNIKM